MIFHDFYKKEDVFKNLDEMFKNPYNSYIGWWMEQIRSLFAPPRPLHSYPWRQQKSLARGQVSEQINMFLMISIMFT